MEEAAPKFVKHVVKRTNPETPVETIPIKDHYTEPMIHLNKDPHDLKKFSEMPKALEKSGKNLHEFGESDLAVFRYFTPDETKKLQFEGFTTNRMYKYLTGVFGYGYLQFREHMRNLYPKAQSSCKKHLITGRPCTGKTVTCLGAMLSAREQNQMCVPLLMLDEWLVETQRTPTNVVMVEEDGQIKEKWEMPEYNTAFLRQFLLVNDDLLSDEHVLLKDCHWAPFHYSIEGTPLKEVIEYALQEPKISNAVVQELCTTLIETKVPLTIVVDDIDMMHHIPETLFESHRKPDMHWNKQLHVTLDRFLLFNYVRDMINSLESGNVYLATGKDNSSEAIATVNSAFKDLEEVALPGTPSVLEYEAYLQFMRQHQFLAKDLSVGEVNELKFLTGMGYEYTHTMIIRI